MQSYIEQWVERILVNAKTLHNLMELGAELGQDSKLSQAQYESVLLQASHNASGLVLGNLIAGSLEMRPLPSSQVWIKLILEARDPEIGSHIIRDLVPFMDVTSLLKDLIEIAMSGSASEKNRVAYTLYGATVVITRTLQNNDVFRSGQSLRKAELIRPLAKALPCFHDKHDHRLVNAALHSLQQPDLG